MAKTKVENVATGPVFVNAIGGPLVIEKGGQIEAEFDDKEVANMKTNSNLKVGGKDAPKTEKPD